jgi:hypothetical protein
MPAEPVELATATWKASTPPGSCDPSPDGASGLRGRPVSSCGPEIHAPVDGGFGSADRFASSGIVLGRPAENSQQARHFSCRQEPGQRGSESGSQKPESACFRGRLTDGGSCRFDQQRSLTVPASQTPTHRQSSQAHGLDRVLSGPDSHYYYCCFL